MCSYLFLACSDADEAAEYERKLIQVAEMHGELMEFNSYLQSALRKREFALQQLREELIDLRGPLAAPVLTGEDRVCDWTSDSFIDRTGDAAGLPVARGTRIGSFEGCNERVLINIWIPSVFLTGATNDLHHVYQVG